VTALGKLLRTTAFKLSIAYLAIFALFAVFLLAYVAMNAHRLIEQQASQTIEAEIGAIADQFALGGPRRIAAIVERRSRQPGGGLYLFLAPDGQTLSGNLAEVEVGPPVGPGEFHISYQLADDVGDRRRFALVRATVLPGGFRLVVGRDIFEQDRLRDVIIRGLGWSLLLVLGLGVAGGIFVTRRVLSRIDSMTDTTRAIMAGDLDGRLIVTGSNDEFDRLAHNLNSMLDRITELMGGLREVSDNIAHDLKTPLTRLRNKAEQALRTAKESDEFRASLDEIIEEADNLIRVFNALLLIARAEARGELPDMAAFDLSDALRDLVELYEPLAEEAGLSLEAAIAPGLSMRGSRELIGQAAANLLDNAIKYGAVTDGPTKTVLVSASGTDGAITITVADHGPGIPEAERDRVVERFVRLEAARSRPGFGLGLSLVAAVARLHGGSLRLEDNGPGLRAVLNWPAAGPANRNPPA
jgi:signal transduction histidine kinase